MSHEIEKYQEQRQAVDFYKMVDCLTIKNEDDFKAGISLVVHGKENLKALDASELGEAKRKSHEAYKQVAGVYKSVSEAISEAVDGCLGKMKAYLEGRKTDPEDDRLYYRETWSADVYDIKELCRAIADGELPEDMVKPNAPALNKLARSMKDLMRAGGVRAVKSVSLCFKSEGEKE